MIDFGAGQLWLNPTGGNLATNPTPSHMLTLQSASLKISGGVKELMGNNKVADDVAPSDMKITGDITMGRVDYDLMNQVYFAGAKTTGMKQTIQEAGSVPAAAPYTYSVVNATHFQTDLGVYYATGVGGAGNGKLVRVTGTPTQGQYAVSNGVYTFAAADTGAGIVVSYVYTSATQGSTFTLNSQTMGYGPVCELWLMQPYQQIAGFTGGVHLFASRISDLSMDRKRDAYNTPKLSFQAFANSAGQILEMFDPGI